MWFPQKPWQEEVSCVEFDLVIFPVSCSAPLSPTPFAKREFIYIYITSHFDPCISKVSVKIFVTQ